ncbi:MAG: hypothetical protein QM655_05680 [Nocardioidaceae bacterium]
MTTGITLDAGPLIQLDRGDRRVTVLLARAHETGDLVVIPGAALAQAIRDPARQTRLSRLLRQPRTAVVPLGRPDAVDVGRLLASAGTSDIADAHVALCARRAQTPVVTSDPDDLHALDPTLELVTV